jgi:hypothetical protein
VGTECLYAQTRIAPISGRFLGDFLRVRNDEKARAFCPAPWAPAWLISSSARLQTERRVMRRRSLQPQAGEASEHSSSVSIRSNMVVDSPGVVCAPAIHPARTLVPVTGGTVEREERPGPGKSCACLENLAHEPTSSPARRGESAARPRLTDQSHLSNVFGVEFSRIMRSLTSRVPEPGSRMSHI